MTPHNAKLPIMPIALRLTVAAVIVAAIGWTVGRTCGAGDAVLMAVGFVWAVNIASVMGVAGFAKRGAMAVAMAHYAAAGGRILACLLVGFYAVRVLGMPTKPMWIALAGAYLPLLMVEAVYVAGCIRAAYPTPVQETTV